MNELWTEEDEKRMEVIGQNGNDGDHYEERKRCWTPQVENCGCPGCGGFND